MTSTTASPIRPKPVALLAAHALVLTLLIGFWPTPRSLYPAAFRAHVNPLLAQLPGPPLALREAGPGYPGEIDTLLEAGPAAAREPLWTSWFSVERIGWWPAAALLALLFATPLAAGRRLLAVVAGLMLLDVYTLARIGVEIAYASFVSANGPGAVSEGFLGLLLRVGSESLPATIPSVAGVLVIWILVANPRHAIRIGPEPRAASSPGLDRS